VATPDPLRVIASQLADGRGPGEWDRRVVETQLPTQAVRDGLLRFLGQIQEIVQITGGKKLGDFQLEELSFAAEVGPDGEFKLIGTGAAEVAAGIRFTVRRKHQTDTADLVRLLVGTEPDDDVTKNRFKESSYVRGEADGQPVEVHVTGTVPTFETNVPLPVVIAGT
jgi:hypothetical protein